MKDNNDDDSFGGNLNEIGGAGEEQKTASSPALLNDADNLKMNAEPIGTNIPQGNAVDNLPPRGRGTALAVEEAPSVAQSESVLLGESEESQPAFLKGANEILRADASQDDKVWENDVKVPLSSPAGTLSPEGKVEGGNETNAPHQSLTATVFPQGEADGKTNPPQKRKSKAASVITVVLTSLLFILAAMIFAVSITAKVNGTQPEFFGISFSVVLTDSMTPEIEVGDLVVVRKCDITEVKEGDNAVFVSLSGTIEGQRIIHKVVEVGSDEEGVYLRTQGVKEGAPIDENYVRADNFVGVEVCHSTFFGNVVTFFSKAQNWILVAVLVALIVFSYKQVRKIIKYAKEK